MITNSVEETIQAGRAFAERLDEGSAVLLYGEMGAGKTHFVKGMALGLGIDSIITSPTFAIVNDYGRLIHFDLFRIHSHDDLYAMGFHDYIGKAVLAIEWAENIPQIEKEFDKCYKVRIEKIDENNSNTRKIPGT